MFVSHCTLAPLTWAREQGGLCLTGPMMNRPFIERAKRFRHPLSLDGKGGGGDRVV